MCNKMSANIGLIASILFLNFVLCLGEPTGKETTKLATKSITTDGNKTNGNESFIEKGRTFVHHAVKRLTFILPAIFFKMGIAFTLLVLVAIAAVNNGFIGFMILVVGLSNVLACLQENKRQPTLLPFPASGGHLAALPHYAHFLDRADDEPSHKQQVLSKNRNTDYDHHNNGPSYSKDAYPYYQTEAIYKYSS